MDCQQASERLPWLLNGTLEPAEAEAVRAHMAKCGVCREDLQETHQAAAVFGAHLPPAALVDLAWGRPAAGLSAEVVQHHLDHCRDCATELELVRESRRLEAAADTPRPAVAQVRWWRAPALAAGLAAVFVAGFWSGRLGEEPAPAPADPRTPGLAARLAEQEGEIRRLRDAAAALEAQTAALRAPQLNLPVFELLPAIARRSAQPVSNEVAVPEGAAFVALLLNSEATPEQPASIEIRNQRGDVVWSGRGLRPSPLGGYTLAVPAALLAPGDYTLEVRAGNEKPQSYTVRVRRAG